MPQAKLLKSKPKTPAAAISPQDGLRGRKRQQTRERLTQAAMELFLANGFEATTLDDIAAAAEISRRSFFHYFASKEDVVLAWQDASTDAMIAAIEQRPAEEPMLLAAENAILAMALSLRPEEAVAMARLKRDTPVLRAREQVKYEKMERAMAAALAKRAGTASAQRRARLVAMITTGAIRLASEDWLANDASEAPEVLVRRTFRDIRAVVEGKPVRPAKG